MQNTVLGENSTLNCIITDKNVVIRDKKTGDDVFVNSVKFEENIVPDVNGMNITDAVYLLESMGWKVRFDGYGKVESQSVEPNTELEKGSVINLVLSSK